MVIIIVAIPGDLTTIIMITPRVISPGECSLFETLHPCVSAAMVSYFKVNYSDPVIPFLQEQMPHSYDFSSRSGVEGTNLPRVGMESPELLSLVENCPKDSETLVTR